MSLKIAVFQKSFALLNSTIKKQNANVEEALSQQKSKVSRLLGKRIDKNKL